MKKMSEIEEEQKKEAGEKIIKLEEEINDKMKKLEIQIRIERSRDLALLVGAEKADQLRNDLIEVIKNQKDGNIRVTFASLDWLFRYYAKMNRIFKTGIDEYLPDLK